MANPKSGQKFTAPQPQSRLHTPVGISFKRFEAASGYCLSVCSTAEIREYLDCFRQLSTLSWQQVLQTSGKGKNKAGLAYTPYPDHSLRGVSRPAWLSDDVKIAGLRASQGMRLFGAYIDHVFYVIWFDRSHDIVDG